MAFWEYEITILDWPHTFLIHDPHEKPSKEQQEFYPEDETIYPFLVDLTEQECSCVDFRIQQTCIHLIIVNRYKSNFTERPKKLPPLI